MEHKLEITHNAYHAMRATLDYEPNDYSVVVIEAKFAGEWDSTTEFPVTPESLRRLAAQFDKWANILDSASPQEIRERALQCADRLELGEETPEDREQVAAFIRRSYQATTKEQD